MQRLISIIVSLNGGWFKPLSKSEQTRVPLSKLTLSFNNPKLSKAFEISTTKHSLAYVRISLALAVFLYIVFSWLDKLVIPAVADELMVIRIISCIIFIGSICLTFTEWGIRNFQLLMSSVVLLACSGIIAMTLISEAAGGYHYYAGLILAIMYAHGLLRMRFIYASATTWFVILGYITATVWLGTTPLEIYVNNIFFLVSANIMGMFASYWLEYYMKLVFWNGRMLNEKNDELKAEYLRKSYELEVGRQMQLNMLPQRSPYLPDYQFCFSMKTASEVGGDYYDFQITGDRSITFAIGDATGHGLQASVMVTAIKLLFSEHASNTDIVEFLKRASYSLSLMDFQKIYMAFAIGRLTDHTLELAGAGMPPAYIYRADSGILEELELKGLPLGSKTTYPYKKVTTILGPEDVVFLMTDGFPELFNEQREMLGYERTRDILLETAVESPDKIIDHLHSASTLWLNNSTQEDDITFFVIKRRAAVQVGQNTVPAVA